MTAVQTLPESWVNCRRRPRPGADRFCLADPGHERSSTQQRMVSCRMRERSSAIPNPDPLGWPKNVDEQEERRHQEADVAAYFDGFREATTRRSWPCSSDEVVSVIHGHGRRRQEAFDREIENDAFEGRPKLTVERVIEEETASSPRTWARAGSEAGRFRFAGVTVFGSTGADPCVECYIVP